MFKIRHILIAVFAVFCIVLIELPTQATPPILDNILDRVTAARNNAATARDRAQEVRDEMRDALQTLSGQMRDFINDYVSEISRVIDEEKDGRDEFVNGSGCETFRQDLVAILTNMETIFRRLGEIADPNGEPVSFADEIQVVNQLPCKVLYPLYRVMESINGVSPHLLQMLEEGANAVVTVSTVVAAQYESVQADSVLDFASEQSVNHFIIENAVTVDAAKKTMKGLGFVFKRLGARMTSKSETGIQTIPIQIWGWVGVELKIGDMRKKMGSLFTGLSDQLAKAERIVDDKLHYAMIIGSLVEIRDNQLQILQNQETMLNLLRNP